MVERRVLGVAAVALSTLALGAACGGDDDGSDVRNIGGTTTTSSGTGSGTGTGSPTQTETGETATTETGETATTETETTG